MALSIDKPKSSLKLTTLFSTPILEQKHFTMFRDSSRYPLIPSSTVMAMSSGFTSLSMFFSIFKSARLSLPPDTAIATLSPCFIMENFDNVRFALYSTDLIKHFLHNNSPE